MILTTAFQEYALESYELDVVDYLLKPFSFQRFVKAISKIRKKSETNFEKASLKDSKPKEESSRKEETEQTGQETEIYIKSGYEFIRIKKDEIFYIVSDADYTEIHLENKKHLSSESLRYWEDFLPKQKFMRIHKSYILNTNKIYKVSGNQIFLENETIIPIGRAYKADFVERFMT